MYKISIILPVYNVENQIDNCIQSLFNQTIGFNNLEIIFVDDCSCDNSYDVIKFYENRFDNIKLFQTSNNSGAAGKPRNIGIKNASSKYIMFLDPDDEYFENACELLYIHILNTNADIVSGNYIKISNGKSIKLMNYKKSLNMKSNYLEINNIFECEKILELIPALWAKIYKKSFLIKNKISFIENVIAQDLFFVSESILKSNKTVYIDYPIVKYSIRDETKFKSVSAMRNAKHIMDYIFIYNKLRLLFKRYDERLESKAAIHLHFSTRQFLFSQTNSIEKLDYLYNSKRLYYLFKRTNKPQEKFKKLFKLIENKSFIESIRLTELINNFEQKNDENLLLNFEEIYLIINLSDNHFSKDELMEVLNLFNNLNLKIILMDMSFPILNKDLSNSRNIEELLESLKIYKNIKYINIFQYCCKKFSSDNNSKDLNIIINNLNNNDIILHDRINKIKLTFDSLNDLLRYTILEFYLKIKENPFIINTCFNFSLEGVILGDYIIENKNFFEDLRNQGLFKNEFNIEKNIDVLLSCLKNMLFNKKIEMLTDSKLEHETRKNVLEKGKLFKKYDNELSSISKKIVNIEKNNITLKKVLNNNCAVKKISKDKFTIAYEDKIAHLTTTMNYLKLKSNYKKRLLLFLPYIYILFKHENIITNIRLYRLLQKSDWFDIGYYLNSNSDISRDKWCKILTPELHYTCHGFDENRKPYRGRFRIPTKKENLIKFLRDS